MPYAMSAGADVWWTAEGEGSPVLLIAGLSSPSAAWFRLTPLLARRHRVLTFDNIGTGQTKSPTGPYSMVMLADAAAAVIEAAGESSAHVLGISLGGCIAQQLALENPRLVRSLELVSTSAGAPHLFNQQETLALLSEAADLPPAERTRHLAAVAYAPTTPAARIDEDLAVRARHPTSEAGYHGQLSGTNTWERLADLPSIMCPTLVVHGDGDRLIPLENARQVADAIPGAHLRVLPLCGHVLFTDQTDEGADCVEKFISDLDLASTSPAA